MKEPSNETYLAAELAILIKNPVIAARKAVELCRLGRRYFALSESLCNYPDDDQKREKSRDRCRAKIEFICNGIADQLQLTKPCWVDNDGGGLGLIFYTNPEGSQAETGTALR